MTNKTRPNLKALHDPRCALPRPLPTRLKLSRKHQILQDSLPHPAPSQRSVQRGLAIAGDCDYPFFFPSSARKFLLHGSLRQDTVGLVPERSMVRLSIIHVMLPRKGFFRFIFSRARRFFFFFLCRGADEPRNRTMFVLTEHTASPRVSRAPRALQGQAFQPSES